MINDYISPLSAPSPRWNPALVHMMLYWTKRNDDNMIVINDSLILDMILQ